MQVTYLGHACYLIEGNGKAVLVDPLLTSTFQHGTATVYPLREIDTGNIPHLDAVVITHCHPGHLELASLALLPSTVPVFYPSDPTIDLVLAQLSFSTRITVKPNQVVSLNGLDILFTGSTAGYSEVGCLFKDDSSTTWYLADTSIDDETIKVVKTFTKEIHFLICNYPGYNHRFFTHMEISDVAVELQSSLASVTKISPKLLSPNFTGLRYINEASWINAVMFPMQSAEFLEYVHQVAPKQWIVDLVPGQVVSLHGNSIDMELRAPFVHASSLDFGDSGQLDLGKGIPPLGHPDYRPKCSESHEQLRVIDEFINSKLLPWLNETSTRRDPEISRYFSQSHRFQLQLIIGDATTAYRTFCFSPTGVVANTNSKAPPNVITRIPVSVLSDWIEARVPYYYAYCFTRSQCTSYSVGQLSDGTIIARKNWLRDPMSLYLNHSLDFTYHPWLRREIAIMQGRAEL